MNNTYVFLCQFDKERHVRIGEIFISPILTLFRHNSWIISSCLLDCTPHLMYEMWRTIECSFARNIPVSVPGPVGTETGIFRP